MTLVAAADCTHTGKLARHSRALRLALGVTVVFMLAEAVGGLAANSLALLADAGHMLGDAASLGLAVFVAWIAQRPATPRRTYGYLRLEIFAALFNGAALLVIAGLIVWQAVSRLAQPPEVRSGLMARGGDAGPRGQSGGAAAAARRARPLPQRARRLPPRPG
jgi:Co/Zn/Cd efflux system component